MDPNYEDVSVDNETSATVRKVFHYSYPTGRGTGRRHNRIKCSGKAENYMRNVIIGGLIQTDFTEIRIRRSLGEKWISRNSKNINWEKQKNFLLTVGLAIAQAFVEYIGKERDAVDILITPDAHLCIFDTNPGGAGYSNQLSKIMHEVIEKAHMLIRMVKENKMLDGLMERTTRRFERNITAEAIEDAYKWFEQIL